jgi:hypothetical protein
VKANLTARFIETVKAPLKGQESYFDRSIAGFSLRVSEGGKKSWNFIYRFHGKSRRLTIGPYPGLGLAEARKLAIEASRQVARGTDPAAIKRTERATESFAELAELYLEKHARARRSGRPVKTKGSYASTSCRTGQIAEPRISSAPTREC